MTGERALDEPIDWIERRLGRVCTLWRGPATAQGTERRSSSQGVSDAEAARGLSLALVNPLDAIAECCLDCPDVLDQPPHSDGLDRRRLIAAPHGTVERNVALDKTRAERHRRQRGGQAHLMAGVPDRATVQLAQPGDHPQIEFLVHAGVRARAMGEQEAFGAENGYRRVDLIERGHAGRQDQRDSGAPVMLEELTICQACRRNLDARRPEGPNEVNRVRVPTRHEPGNVVLPALLIDLSKVVLAQLDPVAVLHVANVTPKVSLASGLVGQPERTFRDFASGT
jgi:hypothetical protein